jgi:hypothetical protein
MGSERDTGAGPATSGTAMPAEAGVAAAIDPATSTGIITATPTGIITATPTGIITVGGTTPDATAEAANTDATVQALDPYAAILALAERELQLARDGRIDDLRSLGRQWDALTANLPAQPPAAARGPLERAAALHERTSATLMCLREAMLCDMRTTARASRTAQGYARQGAQRVHRVDHNA